MCNDYGLTHPITRINQRFRVVQMPLIFPEGLPNLQPREDIRPTDPAPVVRPAASRDGYEWATLRWGFKPGRPKAGPVINFRSEGRAFSTGRCLVPVSHFFEFTGTKSPKSKWKFERPDAEPFCFAGLWRAAEEGWPESFTLLTAAPGPDVAPIHDRQPVVLEPDAWAAWLDPAVPAARLLVPSPAGTLAAQQVR